MTEQTDPRSFGPWLRDTRVKRGWSQEYLAEVLERSLRTIKRWEQDHSPRSRQEYAHVLRTLGFPVSSAQINAWLAIAKAQSTHPAPVEPTAQTTLTPTASSSSPWPTIWNVPFARNPFFTGRDDLLEQLHTHLHTTQAAVALSQPQAISGLGGIGKTQIAIEYIYRYRHEYQAVLWVRADTTEALNTSYTELAGLLQLPDRDAQEQERIVQAVQAWLRTQQDWLLILDNADDLPLVQPFLPTSSTGHLLLTTRAAATGPLAHRLEMEAWTPEKGAFFLLRRATLLAPDALFEQAEQADQDVAVRISQKLGGLPLALDQAGAYLEETGMSITNYWHLYQQHHTILLQRRGGLANDHPASVATTWSLSFQRVEAKNTAAADLLRLLAFLAPDAIPEEILTADPPLLGTILAPVTADPLLLNQAIETLRSYSLIQRHPNEQTLSIHRLVQAVIRDGMNETTSKLWAKHAVQTVMRTLPKVEHKNWTQWERLLAQAQQCAQWIEHYSLFIEEAIFLLEETGWYIGERAHYEEAKPLLEQSLKISEYVHGNDHLDTARAASTLGWLYEKQGKYEQTEHLYQKALAIRKQQAGAQHLDTAISLDNLADLYENQGRYSEAEPLYQQALHIFEQQAGVEHPDTATSLNNLAYLYENQGKYSEAEPLLQRALLIFEQHLGAEHPYTSASLGNLAYLYQCWGKYTQAEPLFLRALHIDEQHSGPEHPYTASSLNNLASLYKLQGRYTEAEQVFQRALTIRELILGSNHPETAETIHSLAQLQEAQGNNEEARTWYARALTVCEQALGKHHRLTTEIRMHLITLLHTMGQQEEATHLATQQPKA